MSDLQKDENELKGYIHTLVASNFSLLRASTWASRLALSDITLPFFRGDTLNLKQIGEISRNRESCLMVSEPEWSCGALDWGSSTGGRKTRRRHGQPVICITELTENSGLGFPDKGRFQKKEPGSGGFGEYAEVLVESQPWMISHRGYCQGFVLTPDNENILKLKDFFRPE